MKTLRDYINLVSETNLLSEKVTLNPDGSVPQTQTVNGVTMNAPSNAVTTGSGGLLKTSDGRAVTSGTPASINVQGIQQAAKVKAYQDAIAAGKTEAEAQNAEAAAGNLAGAEALSKVDINDPATYINAPRPDTGPSSEAERLAWITDPTKTAAATQATQPAPVATQPAAPKQWSKGVLGMGSQGPEVEALQKRLGLDPADGKFGPATRQAVIDLQKKLGVTPADGAYGPQTKAAHDKSTPTTGVTGGTPAAAPAANQPVPPGGMMTGKDIMGRPVMKGSPNDVSASAPTTLATQPALPQAAVATQPAQAAVATQPAPAPSQAYAYTTTPEYKKLLATLQSAYQTGGANSPAYLKAKSDFEAFAAKNKPVAESVGFTNDELTRIVSLIHYR